MYCKDVSFYHPKRNLFTIFKYQSRVEKLMEKIDVIQVPESTYIKDQLYIYSSCADQRHILFFKCTNNSQQLTSLPSHVPTDNSIIIWFVQLNTTNWLTPEIAIENLDERRTFSEQLLHGITKKKIFMNVSSMSYISTLSWVEKKIKIYKNNQNETK